MTDFYTALIDYPHFVVRMVPVNASEQDKAKFQIPVKIEDQTYTVDLTVTSDQIDNWETLRLEAAKDLVYLEEDATLDALSQLTPAQDLDTNHLAESYVAEQWREKIAKREADKLSAA